MSTFTSYSLNVKKDEMPCATDQVHIKAVSITHTEFNHETKAHYSVSITLFPEHIKVLEQALEILKKYQPEDN